MYPWSNSWMDVMSAGAGHDERPGPKTQCRFTCIMYNNVVYTQHRHHCTIPTCYNHYSCPILTSFTHMHSLDMSQFMDISVLMSFEFLHNLKITDTVRLFGSSQTFPHNSWVEWEHRFHMWAGQAPRYYCWYSQS